MIKGQMQVYDAVFDNPKILLVLENFNISLGLGENTIQDMCKQYSINERLFLTIANLFCCKQCITLLTDHFDRNDAFHVLQFLQRSHTYFLDEKIPKLKLLIEQKAATSHGDKYSLIIKKFINDYATEVFEHINYENTIVFPYVESLLKNQEDMTYHIDQFKKHHTNIEDKLIDLKNLLLKHIPSDYDSIVRRRIFFELYDLENDINIHDFIENYILIPIVERLEKEKNENNR